jgi:hypothetical protein
VAASDRLVPFWLDLVWGPLDFKKIGCTRSEDTPLVSDLIWALGARSDGATEREREAHPG